MTKKLFAPVSFRVTWVLTAFLLTDLMAATLCLAQSRSKTADKTFEQSILALSQATWEAYKNRDVAGIKAWTAEDYVSYSQEGPSNLQQDLANVVAGKLRIESYKVIDPKVTRVAKNVAILRYQWEPVGSFEGKPLKTCFVTEVWINRAGKWLTVSYQETPVTQEK